MVISLVNWVWLKLSQYSEPALHTVSASSLLWLVSTDFLPAACLEVHKHLLTQLMLSMPIKVDATFILAWEDHFN